ncbi:unnamed protein product [Symbiodinium natans]|uniref:Uncharacterized protein n=1 Tax=Symbiodinium natans TaxID=878477 RepID=A0A812GBK1_9DINO|nr:unnamed protein product [Symbiodinium natans]
MWHAAFQASIEGHPGDIGAGIPDNGVRPLAAAPHWRSLLGRVAAALPPPAAVCILHPCMVCLLVSVAGVRLVHRVSPMDFGSIRPTRCRPMAILKQCAAACNAYSQQSCGGVRLGCEHFLPCSTCDR